MKKFIFLTLFLFPTFLLVGQTKASINKIYLKENMLRGNVVPSLIGCQYEAIFKNNKNRKSPKQNDFVLVKVKSYSIDGSSLNEKEVKMDLFKMNQDINSSKLQRGIRMMNIGDKYRFFISQKINYDRSMHVYIECPLVKVYEVELMDILKKDGTSKHPKQTARYVAVTQSDDFDTNAIYKIAKQKAYVIAERRRLDEERRIRANQIWGNNNL